MKDGPMTNNQDEAEARSNLIHELAAQQSKSQLEEHQQLLLKLK